MNRPITKNVEWFLYFFYFVIAMFIVRNDIGKVPAHTYLTFIILGLAFLYLGISGIIHKDLSARWAQMNKNEATKWGYLLILVSIVILGVLYFRKLIFR